MITVEEIRAKVKEISRNDSEIAHSMEDNLYIEVLKAIAAGVDNAQTLAKEALKAHDLTFERWHA
jgi:hypothetical protein